ncbi:MAG: hypothetical protein J2P26_14120, partial [Nocardiopsaceae bacterium]|nr:hypothetical protein [Nocardiopsaceae bacterium]
MTPVPHDEDDERALAARVVSALLRENYGGLAGNVVRTGTRASNGNRLGTETGPSNGTRASHGNGASHGDGASDGNRADGGTGATLRLPGTSRVLPLEPDGFVADFRVAEGTPLTLDEVRDAVAALAGTRDAAGAAAFDAECRRTLAETRLRARCLPPPGGTEAERGGSPQADSGPRADSALRASGRPQSDGVPRASGPPRGDGDSWTGAAGQLRYDALAAARPHPVYPASPCRLGLTDADLLACAPEFSPGFPLRWAAVPKRRVTRSYAADPDWWPVPRQVGLDPGLAETHDLFPVHPLTARALAADPLIAGADAPGALTDAGAVLAPRP